MDLPRSNTDSDISDPPPPYNPIHDDMPHGHGHDLRIRLLRRFLIAIFAFTYGVNIRELSNALATTSLASDTESSHSSSCILTESEQYQLYELYKRVNAPWNHVYNNNINLILDRDRADIHSEIILPANALNIAPAYITNQLLLYPRHYCQPGYLHNTYLYQRRSMFFGFWRQEELCKRLISDNKAFIRVAPSEQVRIMLGEAMAEFRRKSCFTTLRDWDGWLTWDTDVELLRVCRNIANARQKGNDSASGIWSEEAGVVAGLEFDSNSIFSSLLL